MLYLFYHSIPPHVQVTDEQIGTPYKCRCSIFFHLKYTSNISNEATASVSRRISYGDELCGELGADVGDALGNNDGGDDGGDDDVDALLAMHLATTPVTMF